MRDSRDGNGTVGIVGNGSFYRDRYIIDKSVFDCIPYLCSCSVTVGLKLNLYFFAGIILTILGGHGLHRVGIIGGGCQVGQSDRRSRDFGIVQIYLDCGACQFLRQSNFVGNLGGIGGYILSLGSKFRQNFLYRFFIRSPELITIYSLIYYTSTFIRKIEMQRRDSISKFKSGIVRRHPGI